MTVSALKVVLQNIPNDCHQRLLGVLECTKFVLPRPRWGSLGCSPDPSVGWGGDTPHHFTPLDAFGVSILRFLAPWCASHSTSFSTLLFLQINHWQAHGIYSL